MISFSRAMSCTARYWLSIASVCLSVCLSICDTLQVGLPVPCSHRLHLEFFENNIAANRLRQGLCAGWHQHGRSGATGTLQKCDRIEHIKAVISPKWCKIGPRLLLRTNRKSHTRFRLAPKSMTSDNPERPKRHSCRNKQTFWSLKSFRIKIRAKYSGLIAWTKLGWIAYIGRIARSSLRQ